MCSLHRYGQTLVAGPDNALYLFGGTSGHVFSNELFRLDIGLGVSERLEPANKKPPPCYKHETVVHGNKVWRNARHTSMLWLQHISCLKRGKDTVRRHCLVRDCYKKHSSLRRCT